MRPPGKRGAAGFDAFYAEIWGERWPSLRESLSAPADLCAYQGAKGEFIKPYLMDRASILAAETLPLREEGERVILDACAAPGGKTLVIASRMPRGWTLLSNELSSERRRRLGNVLDEHLSAAIRSRVKVSGFDAAAAGRRQSERERFDAILLDAPCSSERHVRGSESALLEWTPARPRNLAQRQWALLSSCFLMLKKGGSLVYATCSINEGENDGVAGRIFDKYADAVLENPTFSEGEETAFGRLILPDASGGAGPMYVARVRKLQ
jgi:16S rRNA (cytosine1407-C5)-methyltransferase